MPIEAIKKIIHPIRASSGETYNSYYKTFVEFIETRNGKELFPLSEVVEYFNKLVNKGFRVATLKGVRSALRDPLKILFSKL